MKTFLSLIESQKSFPLKSQGKSMWPILQENDIIYFKKTSFFKIAVNDLIVFRKKRRIICHRVIYKRKSFVITKGDNSFKNDGKIYKRQILGRVYQVKRNGRFFNPETLYLIQSTHYFNEIVKIKSEFDRQKINYLFLKGLPLHLYFEGAHPKRIYADCDVLIDKKDFEKAQNILSEFGYKKVDLHWSKFGRKLMKEEIEATFFKTINGFSVVFDIHPKLGELAIVHLGYLDNLYSEKQSGKLVDYFLSDKKKVIINGERFFILNDFDLILYLALHLFHHNFAGAFRYQFLDTVIRKHKRRLKSIYSQIKKLVQEYELEGFVYPVFLLLKKYYKTPVPANFLIEIKPKKKYQLWYINTKVLKKNIFDDQTRIKAGVERFVNLFILSSNNIFKKILIVFNLQIIYAVVFVLFFKIRSFILRLKLKFKQIDV
ncbi:MAG: hypothetical protein KatS3mg093_448 [Candidatus Parcubacteria bacterium]|nr:MAG: hypothetical protein KatS3mg093_448 [Candidatus Parcubacteria bacterium]